MGKKSGSTPSPKSELVSSESGEASRVSGDPRGAVHSVPSPKKSLSGQLRGYIGGNKLVPPRNRPCLGQVIVRTTPRARHGDGPLC